MSYFYERRGMVIVDKSQDEAEPRRTWGDSIQSTINHTPFNHEAHHEATRNELAIAASKVYVNETRFKIWDWQTFVTNSYCLYVNGKRSEAEFRADCKLALSETAIALEQDRKLSQE